MDEDEQRFHDSDEPLPHLSDLTVKPRTSIKNKSNKSISGVTTTTINKAAIDERNIQSNINSIDMLDSKNRTNNNDDGADEDEFADDDNNAPTGSETEAPLNLCIKKAASSSSSGPSSSSATKTSTPLSSSFSSSPLDVSKHRTSLNSSSSKNNVSDRQSQMIPPLSSTLFPSSSLFNNLNLAAAHSKQPVPGPSVGNNFHQAAQLLAGLGGVASHFGDSHSQQQTQYSQLNHAHQQSSDANNSSQPKKRGRKPKSLLANSQQIPSLPQFPQNVPLSASPSSLPSSSALPNVSNLPSHLFTQAFNAEMQRLMASLVGAVPGAAAAATAAMPPPPEKPRKRGRPPVLSPPPMPTMDPQAQLMSLLGRAAQQQMLQAQAQAQAQAQQDQQSMHLSQLGSKLAALQGGGWPFLAPFGDLSFTSKLNGNEANKRNLFQSKDSSRRTDESDRASQASSTDQSLHSLPDERDIRVPLRFGWKRQTFIRKWSHTGIKGETWYLTPCGRKVNNASEVAKYLQKNNANEMSLDHFSFNPRVIVGEYFESNPGGARGQDLIQLKEEEVTARIDARLKRYPEGDMKRSAPSGESSRHDNDRGRELPPREAKRIKLDEIRRQKEAERLLKEKERLEKLELAKIERAIKQQQQEEAQKKRQQQEQERKRKEEEARKERQEQERKRREMEAAREAEMQRKRQMMIMADLERERRRQHMLLVRALDAHKKQEERERKREELLEGKKAEQERKVARKRLEIELMRELKKPVDDMMLKDLSPLPTLNRIPGLKLPGKAFSETLMVYEFLHNFGETLGFDMESLPSLNTLQNALLNLDPSAEEELLQVVHHLLVCAIDDPGIPVNVTTVMGQKLKDAPITNYNITEILRLYFQSFIEVLPQDVEETRLEVRLNKLLSSGKPFLALNATQKAELMGYLCNELLCNQAIVKQIEENIENVANLRRDRWLVEGELRKWRVVKAKRERKICEINELNARRERHHQEREREKEEREKEKEREREEKEKEREMEKEKEKGENMEEENDDKEKDKDSENKDKENEKEPLDQTGPESDAEEQAPPPPIPIIFDADEEPGMTNEELDKKIEKLNRQFNTLTNKLNRATNLLRVNCLGQDRYRRRYWALPNSGGVFVEGMESAETEELENNLWTEEELKAKEEEDRIAEEMRLKKLQQEQMEVDQDGDISLKEEEKEKEKETEVENDDVNVLPKKEEEDEETEDKKPSESDSDVKPPKEEADKDESLFVEPSFISSKKESKIDPNLANEIREQMKKLESEAPWISPVFYSSIANSSTANNTFGEANSSVDGMPSVSQLSDLNKSSASQNDPQKPWFSILPRMPCDENTITAPDLKPPIFEKIEDESEADTMDKSAFSYKENEENEGSQTGFPGPKTEYELISLINGLPPHLFMQAFLYPHVRSVIFKPSPTVQASSLCDGLNSGPPSGASSPAPPPYSSLTTNYQCSDTMNPISMSIIEELDLCPSLQRRLMQQKEEQHEMPRKISLDYQRGWWRITDANQLRSLIDTLHDRGVRERSLKKHLDKHYNYICSTLRNNACDFDVTPLDRIISKNCPFGAPLTNMESDWNPDIALKFDVSILEQMEVLEDKVSSSSMQVRSWKPLPRITGASLDKLRPVFSILEEAKQLEDPNENSEEKEDKETSLSERSKKKRKYDDKNPVSVGRERLLSLEAAIERRYLKPPLGFKSNTIILSSGETAEDTYEDYDNLPNGLIRWRDAVRECKTSAQLALLTHFLDSCIAWDKSIMRASCQFCASGENEAELLLCDGCDRGYHTYCFKPKMETIPDGDWFCFDCQNKNTIDKVCIVCGKKGKLLSCDVCPKVFHPNCLDPPASKPLKGKWTCHLCSRKTKTKPPAKTVRSRLPLPAEEKAKDTVETSRPEPTPSPKKGRKPKAKGKKPATQKKVKESPPEDIPEEEISQPELDETEIDDKKDKSPSSSKGSSPKKRGRGSTGVSADSKEAREWKEQQLYKLLIEDIEKHEDAWPFLTPVNTKQFPTYKKIIKNPMDFSTIKGKVEAGCYKSREEFCDDIRLIFNNCELFNEDESPVGIAGHHLRAFFEKRWKDLF